MSRPTPPESLAWLTHAAAAGQADARLMLTMLERLEALEAAQREAAMDELRKASAELQPVAEAPRVATDEDLQRFYINNDYALRAVYDLGREHGAAQVKCPLCDLGKMEDETAPPALVAALRDAISALLYIEQQHGRLYGVGWDRVFDAAAPFLSEQSPAAQTAPPAAGIYPVEYRDSDGDGIRILMEPSDETGQVCWVVRNSRHVNLFHEFPSPEAAFAAHQAAKAQPAPPAMQRLMDAPMDARGYVDLRCARLAPPYSPEGELVEPAAQLAPPAAPAPTGGLVELMALAIGGDGDHPANWTPEARRAIREVAAWMRQGRMLNAAELLEQEADR